MLFDDAQLLDSFSTWKGILLIPLLYDLASFHCFLVSADSSASSHLSSPNWFDLLSSMIILNKFNISNLGLSVNNLFHPKAVFFISYIYLPHLASKSHYSFRNCLVYTSLLFSFHKIECSILICDIALLILLFIIILIFRFYISLFLGSKTLQACILFPLSKIRYLFLQC